MPHRRVAQRAQLMQLCNSGREFKLIFLVLVETECKRGKVSKFGHVGLMEIAWDTRRLAAIRGTSEPQAEGVAGEP